MNDNNSKEFEMRDSEVPWPKSETELINYINELLNINHSYGTCVYAISMASTATFNYMAGKLGATGFQASAADLDILRRTRSMKNGFQIINYSDLLYPQYKNKIPTYSRLLEENKDMLKKEATNKLKDSGMAHPDVIDHWEMLSNL